ncbi:thiol-disulfide oxidoreductase DCC family protein [Halalkalibacillus sediminis]|uniref:Thiol-disulfide oxidoreductase DCC family protein n=1 Tax=Halalkalibacillus sediminis TaxID=2018042 RepID=A0A2I0QVW0_9BACI|nr:thiol-disulfide oxidoreductase DCC family protein [Halalkalibacillus sediminis]PKR78429.1 thiol-disulfide oxidoreductase DCC family protein [Halalkalibacillus sediminis]
MVSENKSVVFFDGVCNLCNGAVQFIIKRDKNDHFRFAALQHEFGQKITQQHNINEDSIILVKNGKVHTKSSAVLRIAGNLDGLWKLAKIFLIIPRPIRNLIYDIVAKYRYRWFGQRNECMLPSPEYKKKFL